MLTVIGDIHGKFDGYLKIAQNCEASLCVGDFGFESSWNKLHYSGLSSDNHKVIAGNHDPYDFAPKSPFYIGDYGLATLGGVSLFYIRGGISIDRTYREVDRLNGGPRTYWTQEELSFAQMLDCMDLYRSCKPDIVISHVPPSRFIPELTKSGRRSWAFILDGLLARRLCRNSANPCLGVNTLSAGLVFGLRSLFPLL